MGKTQLNHTATLSIHQWLYGKTLTYCHQELWTVTEKMSLQLAVTQGNYLRG